MATINGNDSVNTLNGTAYADTIYGRGGNDKIYGFAGIDYIDGGTGNDLIQGSDGNDRVLGGDGIDDIRGGNHDDSLSGGSGNDLIYGDAGNDRLWGDQGSDRLYGGAGNDSIEGNGPEEDFMYGGDGNDTVKVGQRDWAFGDAGNDTFNFATIAGSTYGTGYDNKTNGGVGFDTITITNNVSGSLTFAHSSEVGTVDPQNDMGWNYGQISTIDSIERVQFAGTQPGEYRGYYNTAPVEVIGSNQADRFQGGVSNDTFKGGAGDDRMYAGEGGINVLTGGAGKDWFALLSDKDGTVTVTDFKKGEDRLFFDSWVDSINEVNGSTIITMDDMNTSGSSTMKLVGVTGIRYGFDYEINDDHSVFTHPWTYWG